MSEQVGTVGGMTVQNGFLAPARNNDYLTEAVGVDIWEGKIRITSAEMVPDVALLVAAEMIMLARKTILQSESQRLSELSRASQASAAPTG